MPAFSAPAPNAESSRLIGDTPSANPDPSNGGPRGAALAPVRHRQFVVTLLGVYPVITLLLYIILPLTSGWQIWQTTLIITPLMVAIMVFWLIPMIQKRFGRFIMRSVRS